MNERVDGQPLGRVLMVKNAALAAGIINRALSMTKHEHSEDEAVELFELLTQETGEFPDSRTLADNLNLFHTEGAMQ